jgi:hypothetical protein
MLTLYTYFVICLRSTQPKVIYQEEEEDSDEEK